jgi:hypothetical protein
VLPAMPAPYIHPDELMPLVHGELKGTLLWLWDTCYEQHPYVTGLSLFALSSLMWYVYAPLIKKKINRFFCKSVIKAEYLRHDSVLIERMLIVGFVMNKKE